MGVKNWQRSGWILLAGLALSIVGCGGNDAGSGEAGGGEAGGSEASESGSQLSGAIKIDGSSTVYPIMFIAAEMFMIENPKVKVTLGRSGSGAGFKKFLDAQPQLRTDIANASRCIKTTEAEKAAELEVGFVEIPVAYDGIVVAVHPSNDFVDNLTIEELHAIWGPDSTIDNWQDVRPGFPDRPLKLYGPTFDSGTYEYFMHVVNGNARACRQDYSASATIQVVQGVAGDRNALGFFGYSYYVANAQNLKPLAISQGEAEPVKPTIETISSQQYKPLSRPLFIYVSEGAMQREEVGSFVNFFFDHAKEIVEHKQVNYIGLSEKLYEAMRKRASEGVLGTMYASLDDEAQSLYKIYGVAE